MMSGVFQAHVPTIPLWGMVYVLVVEAFQPECVLQGSRCDIHRLANTVLFI
jgi:hypothetical protein